MLNTFFGKFLRFSRRNGPSSTLFGLIIVGILLILIGFLLRSLENQKTQFNDILVERLDLAKGKFELSKLKIEHEYKKAEESIEKFKNEYNSNINALKKDFEQQLAEFDIGQQKLIVKNELKFAKELDNIKKAYYDAKDELVRYKEDLKLDVERLKIAQKEQLVDVNKNIEEDFFDVRDAYEHETTRLMQVRSEIEIFLDEIQLNLQSLEDDMAKKLPKEPEIDLTKLILTRIKLNAFLSEYRAKLKLSELSLPSKFESITIKKLEPLVLSDISKNIQLLESGLEDLTLPMQVYGEAANAIDVNKIMSRAAVAPSFAPSPPEISLKEIISIKGLESLIQMGKFWLLPLTCGVLLLAFSLIFGFFVIQEDVGYKSP